jgi:hypothetical protein
MGEANSSYAPPRDGAARNITMPIEAIDWTGVFWRKQAQ